ncbi:unnamed protein product [Lampetra fluviatilis]
MSAHSSEGRDESAPSKAFLLRRKRSSPGWERIPFPGQVLDRPCFTPMAATLVSAITIGPLAEMLVPVATPYTDPRTPTIGGGNPNSSPRVGGTGAGGAFGVVKETAAGAPENGATTHKTGNEGRSSPADSAVLPRGGGPGKGQEIGRPSAPRSNCTVAPWTNLNLCGHGELTEQL